MRLVMPPSYNDAGNKQLWFVKTEDNKIDEFVNGLLTGLVAINIVLSINYLLYLVA